MKFLITFLALFIFSIQYGMNVTINPNTFDCGSFSVSGNTGCNHNGTLQITVQGNPQGIIIGSVSTIVNGNFSFNITVNTDAPSTANLIFTIITSDDPTGCALAGATDEVGITLSCSCNLSVTVSSTDESCFSCNNGTATVTHQGGVGSVSIVWSTGATDLTILNLAPGSYTVTVTDSNSCEAIEVVDIEAYVCVPFTINAIVEDALCYDDCNGSILLTSLSNGSTAFGALWNEGQNTTFRQNLCAATYHVTVTDTDNCSLSTSFIVSQPPLRLITIDEIINDMGNSSGAVTFSVAPYDNNLIFSCEICVLGGACFPCSSSVNSETTTMTNLGFGTYFVRLTDDNGCGIISDTFTISNTSSLDDSLLSDIALYPNPTTDVFYMSNVTDYDIEVNILNISGQQILSSKNSNFINISHLANGVYFAEIVAFGQKKRLRVVKI